MNRRKYLYYSKGLDRWYISTHKIYITSRKTKEELLPIWEECQKAEWEYTKLVEIKQRVSRKHNPLGKGIIHLEYYDKYALYIYLPEGRRYYGVYPTREEAQKMRRKIINSNYTYDPVNHKSEYRGRLGERRYIYKTPTGRWVVSKDHQHYGTFDSLEDAVVERDLLEEAGWDWSELDGRI